MPPLPRRTSLSPWQEFVEVWGQGCGSELCQRAKKICLARGTIPATVIFIGEGPGESEDSLGIPFCGPAGKLLDTIIEDSIGEENARRQSNGKEPLTYCLTNLVGCAPRDEDGIKVGQPSPEDIECCKPRLEAFLELCDPQLVVCVGKLAAQHLHQGYRHSVKLPDRDTPIVEILHPSWALRNNTIVQQSYQRKSAVIIATELENL